MEKLKQYVKMNYKFISIMIIGIIAFCIQIKYVVLYADDLSLGIIAREELKEIGKFFISNYMNWGRRANSNNCDIVYEMQFESMENI